MQQQTSTKGQRRIRVAHLLANDHIMATPMMQPSAAGRGRVDTSLRITCARMPNGSKVTLAKARRLHQHGNAACTSCHNRGECSNKT